MPHLIADMLAEYELPPTYLGVELTETPVTPARIVALLRNAGAPRRG